ncbi:transporter [Marivirga salinae]|uniref:Transporter n=1 Tax=Marivirga salinarum TaxID=3059078 RepID=A0AA51NE37_9BACT|nr:transporter [Marivirga sp. BDSF4-3]WMN12281.1 transporter [Marivirga sp. BDSF4-3]
MKRYLLIILISFPCISIYGQYSETIATARPGAANGAGTVGKGILQFQAGLQFDNVKDIRDSSNWSTDNISENLVVRFGIRERFEVSAVINHINSTEYISESAGSILRKGFNTSLIRARTKINENMAFQVGIETKLRGKDYQINYIAPRFRVMYNTKLGENASLTTNLGAFWNGNDNKPRGFYVFSYSLALTNKISLIAESYGDFIRTGINNFFDIGLGYNVNKDMLIDLNAGWGENYPYKSHFVTAGVSYRIITRFRPEEKK